MAGTGKDGTEYARRGVYLAEYPIPFRGRMWTLALKCRYQPMIYDWGAKISISQTNVVNGKLKIPAIDA